MISTYLISAGFAIFYYKGENIDCHIFLLAKIVNKNILTNFHSYSYTYATKNTLAY